jgi:anti-sigma factor RsiW
MRSAHDLSCAELVELVTEYLEDALDRDARDRFERHLAGCGHCAAYLDQIRLTVRVAGRLREDSLEPEARDALLAAFRGWRSPVEG